MKLRRAIAICGVLCGLALWARSRARAAGENVQREIQRAQRTL